MSLVKQETPLAPMAREMKQMRNRLRRFFEEPFSIDLALPMFDDRFPARLAWSPAVEASETPTEYVITAELPGISPESVEVAMSEGVLTLRGSKQDERRIDDKKQRYHLWEREYGGFERTFRFPLDIDAVKVAADFANGVLTVRLPKMEVTPPAVRTIPIAKR